MLPTKITISVEKPSVPPGMVLLEDAGTISSGLHDSLARLVQRQLGFPWRAKLREEAKRLTRVALTGVSKGSGVLEYTSLPAPGVPGRPPAAIAALDLISGIRSFEEAHRWPPYLPATVRNRFGAAVAPVFTEKDAVLRLIVHAEGTSADCAISSSIKEALQTPETFTPGEPVEVIGKVFDLNIRTLSFKVDAGTRVVTVHAEEDRFRQVDEDMRWARVFVGGLPQDDQCRTVHEVAELRLARDEEDDGVSVASELRRGEKTAAYRSAVQRSEELLSLDEGWDTYQARSISKRAMAFSLNFLRDAIGVFMDHDLDVPAPFMVPTPSGGVQFEWQVGSRELKLEIPEKGRFSYLTADGRTETEGEASRWTAMRLLRWAITGEEAWSFAACPG